jgi:predicted ATPase
MEGVAGLIASRLDSLSRDEVELLQTASVIGTVVAVRLLAAVHASVVGGQERDLLETAQALLQRGFLKRDKSRDEEVEFENEVRARNERARRGLGAILQGMRGAANGQVALQGEGGVVMRLLLTRTTHFSFAQMTRQTVYERMLVSQRELIHGRVVDELEYDVDQLQTNYGVIVKHCECAGDMSRTRKFLLAAGMQARRLGAELDAIHYLTRLEKLDEGTEGRFWKPEDRMLSFKESSAKIKLEIGQAWCVSEWGPRKQS